MKECDLNKLEAIGRWLDESGSKWGYTIEKAVTEIIALQSADEEKADRIEQLEDEIKELKAKGSE